MLYQGSFGFSYVFVSSTPDGGLPEAMNRSIHDRSGTGRGNVLKSDASSLEESR